LSNGALSAIGTGARKGRNGGGLVRGEEKWQGKRRGECQWSKDEEGKVRNGWGVWN